MALLTLQHGNPSSRWQHGILPRTNSFFLPEICFTAWAPISAPNLQWCLTDTRLILIPGFICSADGSSWEAGRGNTWGCWIGHQHFTPQVQGQSCYLQAWLIRISSARLCCQLWTCGYPGCLLGSKAALAWALSMVCCSFKATCLLSWVTTPTQSLPSTQHEANACNKIPQLRQEAIRSSLFCWIASIALGGGVGSPSPEAMPAGCGHTKASLKPRLCLLGTHCHSKKAHLSRQK